MTEIHIWHCDRAGCDRTVNSETGDLSGWEHITTSDKDDIHLCPGHGNEFFRWLTDQRVEFK